MAITPCPVVILPTTDTPLAAVCKLHPISSVQPLPMCDDGGIDWAIPGSLTAIILLNATPSIILGWFVSRLVRRAERRPASGTRRSIRITHILTFIAVANITYIPVIHVECPAAH
jgi:hypothetical protein